MPLILAIEPDKRQSSQLAAVVKGLKAELVQGATATDALAALHGRVPDLVLTTSLISPRDDASLAAHLRQLGAAAAHVQTVTIPLLGSAAPARAKGGMLAALRREKPQAPMTDGCAPDIFADQVRQYLATAEEQKAVAATRQTVAPEAAPAVLAEEPEVVEAFEPVAEFLEAAPVEAALPEPEPEPAGLPLSQLLQLVSDAAPAAEPPAIEESSVEDFVVEEFVEAAEAAPAEVAPAEPASSYGDLYVDPMAAQALEELSRQAPAQSLADGIPGEPPVPVVEMQAFQSLDDLASLFAATPSPAAPAQNTYFEPATHEFASLFATPAPSRPAEPIDVPGIDPSLFASVPESLFVPVPEPLVEPAPEPVLEVAATPVVEFVREPVVEFEPEPVVDITPEPVVALAPEQAVELAPEPVAEVVPEPAAVLAPEPMVEAVPEPVLTEFEVPEPEPMMAEAFEAEPEPVFEDGPIAFEPVAFEPPAVEPMVEAPVAVAASPAFDEDEEIALDVDAFAFTAPEPAAPAEPERFSFTLVEGFGDAWSDFEVPSVADMAVDLGVGAHAPVDPYGVAAAPTPAEVRRANIDEPLAAPALDDEALSLIGDAARRVSLDAFVIKEFERGSQARRVKKAKKKVHAGATQVAPAAERPAKPSQRPVQDEWGMFDPEQCGFAALEDEEGAETRPTTGTRVRVISY